MDSAMQQIVFDWSGIIDVTLDACISHRGIIVLFGGSLPMGTSAMVFYHHI
jgi:hypothetical protein